MNPELFTFSETCKRKAVWSEQWEWHKLRATEMVYRALRVALTDTEREDHGTLAGETVIGLMADRGLDTPHQLLYDIGINHAAMCDLLAIHLRPLGTPAWQIPFHEGWESRCYLKDDELHRVILVDHWDDERQAGECHSWYTLGEMAMYELPMILHILVLGHTKFGKRYSPWTKGLLHPQNNQLKFARTTRHGGGFKDTWRQVWREDRGEISREKWLQAMARDGVFKSSSITKRVELPSAEKLSEIRCDMERITETMAGITDCPPKVYGACDWPIPCQFRRCCWAEVETSPSTTRGYVKIMALQSPALSRPA